MISQVPFSFNEFVPFMEKFLQVTKQENQIAHYCYYSLYNLVLKIKITLIAAINTKD